VIQSTLREEYLVVKTILKRIIWRSLFATFVCGAWSCSKMSVVVAINRYPFPIQTDIGGKRTTIPVGGHYLGPGNIQGGFGFQTWDKSGRPVKLYQYDQDTVSRGTYGDTFVVEVGP
jgi:hypothetical protein